MIGLPGNTEETGETTCGNAVVWAVRAGADRRRESAPKILPRRLLKRSPLLRVAMSLFPRDKAFWSV